MARLTEHRPAPFAVGSRVRLYLAIPDANCKPSGLFVMGKIAANVERVQESIVAVEPNVTRWSNRVVTVCWARLAPAREGD